MTERKPALFVVLLLLTAAGIGSLLWFYPLSPIAQPQQDTRFRRETTVVSPNAGLSGQPSLYISKLYAGLGYPKITYDGYPPYLPSKPNFTVSYQTKSGLFQVGTLEAPAIGLQQAVTLAAKYAKLDPTNYSLAEADFSSGTIINGSMGRTPAQWVLYFARTYQGYWVFGDVGQPAASVVVNINALNGTLRSLSDFSWLPRPTHYQLKVNLSQAVEIAQTSKAWSGAPASAGKNPSLSSVDLRIAELGSASHNDMFQHITNASLDGQERLCWMIGLLSSPADQRPGYTGFFLIDGETGEIISERAGYGGFSGFNFESVTGTVDWPSAKNVIVRQETTQISESALGLAKPVTLVVPNVLIVKPGSTGSIDLNITSTLHGGANISLSFSNPLPGIQDFLFDELPEGVSAQFVHPSLTIPRAGSTTDTLSISAAYNAPEGTYLLLVNVQYTSARLPGTSTTQLLFFLSVWDGVGQWPPPPVVK